MLSLGILSNENKVKITWFTCRTSSSISLHAFVNSWSWICVDLKINHIYNKMRWRNYSFYLWQRKVFKIKRSPSFLHFSICIISQKSARKCILLHLFRTSNSFKSLSLFRVDLSSFNLKCFMVVFLEGKHTVRLFLLI